ncbi:MAG: sigma-70 family RNA polymerase sigma factor [Lactobacillus sp.]|jgi:RNA polymerase sporulation-specific sigma factor|nr:sigma-70 family RNA polymerase sigma factor [Lactobacillus sp.]
MLDFHQENELVLQVVAGSSDALERLVNKYRPLIFNIINRYHLHLYDPDDWMQEARLECLLTCRKFDPTAGSRFGSFYKLRFQNHIHSKLRKQFAKKRQTDFHCTPLEKLTSKDQELRQKGLVFLSRNPAVVLADFRAFCAGLSPVESQALLYIMGQKTPSEIWKSHRINLMSLKNAQQRVRQKLKRFLQAETG